MILATCKKKILVDKEKQNNYSYPVSKRKSNSPPNQSKTAKPNQIMGQEIGEQNKNYRPTQHSPTRETSSTQMLCTTCKQRYTEKEKQNNQKQQESTPSQQTLMGVWEAQTVYGPFQAMNPQSGSLLTQGAFLLN